MELRLVRNVKTEHSTIGVLYVNNDVECLILEDVDRGLDSEMELSYIEKAKVYGKTAIPTGRYEIAITFSNKFQKYLPLIMNVKAFDGIRIHSGNSEVDTLGCLLTGTTQGNDFVGGSRAAFSKLFAKLKAVEKKEKIYITIV